MSLCLARSLFDFRPGGSRKWTRFKNHFNDANPLVAQVVVRLLEEWPVIPGFNRITRSFSDRVPIATFLRNGDWFPRFWRAVASCWANWSFLDCICNWLRGDGRFGVSGGRDLNGTLLKLLFRDCFG